MVYGSMEQWIFVTFTQAKCAYISQHAVITATDFVFWDMLSTYEVYLEDSSSGYLCFYTIIPKGDW